MATMAIRDVWSLSRWSGSVVCCFAGTTVAEVIEAVGDFLDPVVLPDATPPRA